jgi:subtilisin family serine protease
VRIPWIRVAVTTALLGAQAAVAPPSPAAALRSPQALRFARGEVVVIAGEGVIEAAPGGAPRALGAGLGSVLSRFGLDRARRADPEPRSTAADGALPPGTGMVPREPRTARVWLLSSTRPDFDPPTAAAALRATGAVRAAIPNYRIPLFITTPNDLYVVYQWYVDDGSFADVRLPYAWDTARGDTTVTIAIIDTGVDIGHPDLAPQIWTNWGEIPGNALDDDGNGLIDDVHGWDFGTGDNDPSPQYTPDPSGVDVGFHGTFCAGIAAAATDNGDGIAGAGWNCRILPLKAANPDSGLTSDAIAGAIAYAADQGASVISMSFGAPGDPGVPEFFQTLVDMATAAGSLCVAAAGNEGVDTPMYPAACDRVLAVGATDFNNARATFSNWGPWVDVAAPGSTMWSTIARNYELSLLDQLFYMLLFGWDGVNPYMYGDGTSFACPLVAGVCGLVRARYPFLTPQMAIQHVIATGDAVAFDYPIGSKVNAQGAVGTVPTAVEAARVSPARLRLTAAPNPSPGSSTIQFNLPSPGRVTLRVHDVAGRCVRTVAYEAFEAGPHVLRWDGRDDRGVPLPAAVYFARLECGGAARSVKIVLLDR